ncbi:MAG TPA: acyltransferase [Terriglobales bacterium]|nr:acyltransferase [Terriglobales bacterium]
MRRIPSLDGVRAISITLVILSHLVQWKHVSLRVLGNYGELGVHVFFVLSGYLITKLLLQEYDRSSTISLQDFYVRRAFRIFPAALVFFVIAGIFFWHQMRWYHLAAALFYVANMDVTRPWMFGHLWSLSIEEQFYLLWPFVLRRWYRHRVGILLCVLLATPVFRTVLYAFKVRNGFNGSLPVFADQLAIGCLLAMFANRVPKITGRLAALMVVGMFVIPWFPANTPARTLFMLFALRPILDVCIAGIVLHVIQYPYRVLNCRPVVWVGQISYSLYLWQELFCSNAGLHAGYILVVPAILCACLSYYAVEQPMLRMRERWRRKMRIGSSPLVAVERANRPVVQTSAVASGD